MSAPPPARFRVCFVCTGNICRSPMAESVFRARVEEARLGGLVTVTSAGTGDWFEGEPADRRATAVLAAHGYREEHIARQFRAEWFAGLDLVIALDAGHVRGLRRLAPTPEDAAKIRLLRGYDDRAAASGAGLDVPDPYFGDMDDFELCLRMCEDAAGGLLDAVRDALAAGGTVVRD